jgi:CRAL/TRIO domain
MGKNLAEVDPVTGRVLETEELKVRGLNELRAKIQARIASGTQQYPRTDDAFLLAFLRARKYNIEKADEICLNFAKFWYSHPDVVENLKAADVRQFTRSKFLKMLPGRDKQGNSLAALYMSGWDLENFSAELMAKFSLYILLNHFEHPELQVHGAAYIETFEGFSFMKAMQLGKFVSTPEQKELMNLGTDCFPIRISRILLVKQPWYFSFFWAVVKPFLKKKLRDRLMMVGDVKGLEEFIPLSEIPVEFGGELDYAFDGFLDEMEKLEKSTGMIGGFALPLSVDDPTGEKRRAAGILPPLKGN